jgi:NADH dehydrogenase
MQGDANHSLPVLPPPDVVPPATAMRVAITGGTGFVGGHLAQALSAGGHEAVLLARGVDRRSWAQEVLGLPGVSFVQVGIGDERGLLEAFEGCDAVAHCAGINREVGSQTYEAVHVRGTLKVVRAAETAGVRRLAIVSFLRARPDCGSPYHESKWVAEEIVRASSCEWTVLKPGMMFGRGDHMLDHLSHALYTFPVFLGIGTRRVRPLAVGDAVEVLVASLVEGRLANQTVGLVGPTEIGFDDAARLVAGVIGKRRLFVPAPLAFHHLLAVAAERSMTVPLIAIAQVRILKEEVVEPLRAPDLLPDDLTPSTPFDAHSIRAGLPDPGPFRLADLRWCPRHDRREAQGSILVYDADCGFCTRAARWAARKFSHGEQAEAWQFLGEGVLERYGLSVNDVQEAAWWVDSRGRRERGHRAVGRALLAGGGLRGLVGWFVLTPPTSRLAAGIYRLVVRWALPAAGRYTGMQSHHQTLEGLRTAVRIVRPASPTSMTRLLSAAETADPTYPERGATLTGEQPEGYHHLSATIVIGRGPQVFARASQGLHTWRAHRFNGVRVFPADAPVQAGATVVVTLGARIGAIAAPCRIIATLEEPQCFGFAYGTLPGHPEQGEESFVVTLADDGVIRFEIRAFSRPGDPLTRLAGPLGRKVQSIATKQYQRALSRFVRSNDPP